jgi:hypothetical protein
VIFHITAPNVDYPISETSTLELWTADFNYALDG